ncbi:MAG: hypothetical protein ACI9P7_001406, partial [Candidatus Azotimanducaceae bacterium]
DFADTTIPTCNQHNFISHDIFLNWCLPNLIMIWS